MPTGHGESEWFENIQEQLNYLTKDLGLEDVWEDNNNEDGCANP